MTSESTRERARQVVYVDATVKDKGQPAPGDLSTSIPIAEIAAVWGVTETASQLLPNLF